MIEVPIAESGDDEADGIQLEGRAAGKIKRGECLDDGVGVDSGEPFAAEHRLDGGEPRLDVGGRDGLLWQICGEVRGCLADAFVGIAEICVYRLLECVGANRFEAIQNGFEGDAANE